MLNFGGETQILEDLYLLRRVPYCLVERYQRFGGTCCIFRVEEEVPPKCRHALTKPHSATSHKTKKLIFHAMKIEKFLGRGHLENQEGDDMITLRWILNVVY
jgi:hypothetical protein